jgi:type I restriction-modification system DNA methylase subunit
MATNLADKEVNELIEICKELGLDSDDYLTKNNKPRAKNVIIKAIEKFMGNKKPYKAEPTNKNIRNSMGDIGDAANVEIQEINEIVWTLERNSDTNTNYRQVKDRLKKIVNKNQKELYTLSCVGVKAQNDIMKILAIHIFNPQFHNEESELYKRCKKLLDDGDVSQEKYDKYMSYCCDLNNINKTDNPVNAWKMFVLHFLRKIFKGIYLDEDSTFNFGNDEGTFMKLIEGTCELKIDKDFIDAFSTSFGDIHEAFHEYSGGKAAKELGQFFTPRHLIHAILHGCGLNDMIKEYDSPSIYDPCMGTGGLLTRAYSNGNILSNNIYGCETERDTIKFGQISTLLATGVFTSNLQLCNSLCDNRFVGTKKFDVIFTNPPFGTSMKYKEIEKRFNENKEIKGINIGVNFKDVYPIDINNGTCLFMQHCIYMLEENGTCAIVVPDGKELFSTSKNLINYRKYICETVNILKIVNVGANTFEHTPIKTSVIIFKKNGSTENIEFMEIADSCDKVKVVSVININNIRNNNYSLSYNAYITKTDAKYGEDVVVKTLGEVCEINYGTRIVKGNNIEGDYPVYGSGRAMFSTKTFNREGFNILIGRFALSLECVRFVNEKLFLNDSGLSVKPKTEKLFHKYLGYYLLHNQHIIYNLARGPAQKNLDIDEFKLLKIPIPSLERQQEIIEECEQITKSIDTIKLRKEQKKSDGLLFKKYHKKNVLDEFYKNSEVKSLGEVCEFQNGKGITKDELVEGEYPVIGGGQQPMGFHNEYNTDENTILCSSSGAYSGFISKYNKKVWASDCFSIIPKGNINNNYIYYFLKMFQEIIYKLQTGLAQPHVYSKNLEQLKIPIPSLENQEHIIEIYKQMIEEHKKKFVDKIAEQDKEIEILQEICKSMFYC